MRYISGIPRVWLLATAFLAACGPFHHGAGSGDGALIFENASLDQAAVYAVMPGTDMIRLGTVLPGQTDTLRVPTTITGRNQQVSIAARLLGARTVPQTGPVSFAPGDAYHIRLTNNASILSITPVDLDEP